MATTLFFRSTQADWSTGHNDTKLNGSASEWLNFNLSTTRGAGATTSVAGTVNGPVAGVEIIEGVIPVAWISPPLDADITIAGSVTWNLRAAESNMSANASINGRLEVVDGATGAITLIDQTARTTELGVTTEAANNFAETPAAGVACKRGDRLRVRVFADDAAQSMAAGFAATFWYDGPTGGASGDSFLTLTETLTFVSEPAGTQIFLTDTASAVSTASVDREAWTSRGAGAQTDVRNTAAGWTAPLQMTDTAGGTVVDWFTKPLTAFTLGGAVRCNIRGLQSNVSANAAFRVEVAVTANDGTGAVTWGATTYPLEAAASEAASSFLVSGDDTAVSTGQRLRIRVLIDDSQDAAMATGHTVTLYYAGASGGSGDTFLTFSQTLTAAADTINGDFTLDAVLKKTAAASFSLDAVALREAAGSSTLDAVLASTASGSFTFDAVVHRTESATAGLDAVLRGTASASFLADAIFRRTISTETSYRSHILDDSPIAYWRLGEPSGTVANDEIGTADGAYVNTPTLGVSGLIADSDTAVTFARASGERITVAGGNLPAGGSSGASLECWFNLTSEFAIQGLVRWGVINNTGGHVLYLNITATAYDLHWQYHDGTAVRDRGSVNTWTDGTTGQTYHVVVTHDYAAETITFYLNGEELGTEDVSTFGPATVASAGLTGEIAGTAANPIDGTLDEPAIYSYVLTPTQVATHYAIGTGAGTAGPVLDAVLAITTSANAVLDAWFLRTETRTTALDAVLFKTTSSAFSIDAVIMPTATIDAVLRRTQAGSFALDAVVMPTTTLDAILRQTIPGAFTLDAFVAGVGVSAFSLDAVLFREQSATWALDAVLRRTESGSFDLSAVIQPTIVASLTFDAVIQGSSAGTFSLDATVLAAATDSLTVDAVIRRTESATITLDAFFLKLVSGSATVDAVVLRQAAATFTLDAFVLAAGSAVLTLDAVLLRSGTGQFTLDASVASTETNSFTLESVLFRTETGSFSTDAIAKRTASDTLIFDAILDRVEARTFEFDAVQLKTSTASVTFDAVIGATRTAGSTLDSVVRSLQQGAYTLDALLLTTSSGTFAFDATVVGGNVFAVTLDAVVQAQQSGAATVDAVLRGEFAGGFDLSAMLAETHAGATLLDALLRREEVAVFTADAILQETVQGQLLVDAVLQSTHSEVLLLDAYVAESMQSSFKLDACTTATRAGSFATDAYLIGLPLTQVEPIHAVNSAATIHAVNAADTIHAVNSADTLRTRRP